MPKKYRGGKDGTETKDKQVDSSESVDNEAKESSPENLSSADTSTGTSIAGNGSWTMISEASLPETEDRISEVDIEDDKAWQTELRHALEEQCGLFEVCRIAGGKVLPEELRIRAWQACLDVPWNADEVSSGFNHWDGIFNLKNQARLGEDCKKLIQELNRDPEMERLSTQSDIESVVTAFCANKHCDYDPSSSWMHILKILLPFHLPSPMLYEFFSVIVNKFVPKDGSKNEVVHHLFRLIVLYHDPELCNFIDTKKISIEDVCASWFSSLLATDCTLETTMAVWDIYFQNDDSFLIFFLSLVLLMSVRDQILEKKDDSKLQLTEFLKTIPGNMGVEDVIDFYEIANNYLALTPKSLREANWTVIFGTRPVSPTKRLHIPIPQALCLPVTIEEIVTAATRHSGCRFFVIDCRPPAQYNSGHLVTAFHLDAQLFIQDAQAFDKAIETLLESQKQALESKSIASGEHLCFMGSGFEAEDQFVHMVVARMLQHHHKYVSLADGGYEALLHYVEINALETDRILVGTDIQKISPRSKVRQSKSTEAKVADEKLVVKASTSFFNKLKSAVQTQLPVVKEKISTYITSPQASSSAPVRHVSAQDKPRRAQYRPQSVFVFDDADDDYGDKVDYPEGDLQNWKEFVRRPDVLAHFECLEYVSAEESVPAILVISETDVYNFRPSLEQPEMATLSSQHTLMEVLKIVCRRRIPELITIKYGTMEDGNVTVDDVEKFYIAKSGDAIKAIKLQIVRLMSEQEGRAFDDGE
ncbi:hypothetical protein RvY_01458 [Ramazzottius varieornatus]|uniref:TBC1 domain family member 23 n=1 Tax=Ramazzottius varieornatus TaxID=947166 RepID=A0A1D1UR45_RAMVA|nr:hypothetical protein RvY_01458 [Ramazzottius varieornatus]